MAESSQMTLRLFIFILTLVEVVTVVACITLLGFLSTLGLCFLSMIIGTLLLQRQGLATAERFVTRLQAGQPPMDEAWDGFCIMVAGMLFIIPGLATDMLALILLVPPIRRLLRQVLVASGAVKGHYWFDRSAVLNSPRSNVIDATYRDVTPER